MSETQKRKAAKKKHRSQNRLKKSEQLLDNLGSFDFSEATVVCSSCQKSGEECQCPKEETSKDNEKLARIIDYTDSNLNKLISNFPDLDLSEEEEDSSVVEKREDEPPPRCSTTEESCTLGGGCCSTTEESCFLDEGCCLTIEESCSLGGDCCLTNNLEDTAENCGEENRFSCTMTKQ